MISFTFVAVGGRNRKVAEAFAKNEGKRLSFAIWYPVKIENFRIDCDLAVCLMQVFR